MSRADHLVSLRKQVFDETQGFLLATLPFPGMLVSYFRSHNSKSHKLMH